MTRLRPLQRGGAEDAVIGGAFLLIIGCVALFATDLLYEIRNTIYNLPEEDEIPRYWLVSTRVGGAVMALVGLVSVIAHTWSFFAQR